MGRPLRRWVYGIAAVLVFAVTVLWAGSVTYSCPDVVEPGASARYDGQGGVEIVTRIIVAVLGVTLATWFAWNAVRKPSEHR